MNEIIWVILSLVVSFGSLVGAVFLWEIIDDWMGNSD